MTKPEMVSSFACGGAGGCDHGPCSWMVCAICDEESLAKQELRDSKARLTDEMIQAIQRGSQ